MTTVSEEITATGIVAVVRLEHYDRALEIEAERVEKAVDPVGLPAMPTQEDLFGPEGVVKQLSAALIERCLQGELTTHLGYEKSQRAQEARPNQRNGDAQKTLKSDAGELEIAIPRDREGSYDPLLVKRGQRILTGLSEKILWLYAHGLSTRDIQAQILNWSGVEVSPLGDLVVIQWFEAEKSGLHFIGLTKYGDQLLDDADLPLIGHEGDVAEDTEEEEDERFFVETNLTTSPVFSPDGRFILFCWQRSQHWWTDVPDDVYVEGDLPARVGECHVGYVQIIDGETNTTHSVALFANVPLGWQPTYEGDRSNELLNEPVFIDDQHFQVQLPTGETCTYSVFE